VKKFIKEIEAIFNRSGLTANIEFKQLNIMLGLYGGEDLSGLFILYYVYLNRKYYIIHGSHCLF
jgi:hypothetical protein